MATKAIQPIPLERDLEEAVNKAASAMTCVQHRRATRAKEAINGLVGRGILGCHEGRLWFVA